MNSPAILITGGTGFLGAYVLAELVSKGYEVRATFRNVARQDFTKRIFEHRFKDSFADFWRKISWIEADLEDIYAIESALEGIEVVFHTAGMVSFRPKDKAQLLARNYGDTQRLVNEALERKVKYFCYVSSIAALGRSELNEIIDENRSWKRDPANSFYARSKHAGEMEVWRGIEEGLRAVIVNPSVILGEGIWESGTASFFNRVFNGVKSFPPGETGFVGVKDVAKCMIQLWEKDIIGQRFIVNAENRSWESVLSAIASALSKPLPTRRVNPRLLFYLAKWVRQFERLGIHPFPFGSDALRNAALCNVYKTDKIINALEYRFESVDKVIAETAERYLANLGKPNESTIKLELG
jgi:dihydroflavonol-4-reductase